MAKYFLLLVLCGHELVLTSFWTWKLQKSIQFKQVKQKKAQQKLNYFNAIPEIISSNEVTAMSCRVLEMGVYHISVCFE